ncbi:MAG: DNA-directed RNA polymerase subunit B [archaeon]
MDVYLDNKFVGSVQDPKVFVDKLLSNRRAGKLSHYVNVLSTPAGVFVETSRGRCIRPLIIVKDGKPLLTEQHIQQLQQNKLGWWDLVKQGIIEYLDATEEESAFVALSEEELSLNHTHLEVAPCDILGLCTNLVPFGNFNHAVRLVQGSKNQKHAIGFYAANFFTRMDMDVSLLHYAQVPICSTVLHSIYQDYKHPQGLNVTLAVMAFDGYNMEDAIVVNQGSIDRGLGRSSYYRPMVTEELRYSGGLIDEVCIPDKDVKGYKSERDYRFLEPDGIIYPEARIGEGDVIIGKTSPPRFLSSTDEYNLTSNQRRESSAALKHGEHGVVDFVIITENSEGNKLIEVRLRDERVPEIGDKFTSRHGQKGVIGLIIPAEDMPFSERGIIPDILFSPHSLPTRMTVAHLIELVGGKVGALSGRYVDGTMFQSEREEDLRKELASYGFSEDGTEIMYSGITGKQYTSRIFVGNMFYLKLKHLVQNKIHSRGRGSIQLLTRQPTEGRAKEGGLRLGEMEKDTLIAHGASLLLKERFDSDKVIVYVCLKSGLIGYYDARKKKPISPLYGEEAELVPVEMSYAFKLFLDELKTLGVYPRIIVESKFREIAPVEVKE